jgi:hypothetical protein
MGILNQLPPDLISLITWIILWGSASILIMIISLFFGRLLGDIIEGLIGRIK